MRSPKSRILQLKQEIAELEQKLVTSCSSKPEPPQPAPPQSFSTSSPEESRKFTFRNSVPSHSTTETPEVNKKLRILSVKKPIDLTLSKPREKSASRCTNPSKSSENDSTFQSSLQRKPAKEEFTISRSKLQEERTAIIEKEAERVNKEKIDLEIERERIDEDLVMNENLALMCKEDVIARYAKRSELVGLREELEFVLESIEIQYPDDLEFCGDEESLQMNSTVRNKVNTKSLTGTQNLENSIENNKILISALEKKYARVLKDIENLICHAAGSKLNQEIRNVERVIENKTLDFDLDTLENVILDLNALERFDIDEEILRLQLNEVLHCEKKLQLEFDYSERDLQEKLKSSCNKREQSQYENELTFLSNQYRNRFAAINHWKEEVQSVISRTVSNIHVSVQDRSIIDEFSATFGKIPSNSSRQQMKNLVEGYLTKVTMRDKMIQGSLSEIKKKFVEKTQISGLLSKAQIEKNKLQNEKFKFSKENIVGKESLVQKTQRMSEVGGNPVKDRVLALRKRILQVCKWVEDEEKEVEVICRNLVEVNGFLKNLKKKQVCLKNSMSKLQANQMVMKF